MEHKIHKIGHFALLQNAYPHSQYEGQRVEILGDCMPHVVANENGIERMVMGHEVLLADGNHLVVTLAGLKHILGGRECDRVVRWSDCMWKPIPGLVARLVREAKQSKALGRSL